jgi:hypothetical protein
MIDQGLVFATKEIDRNHLARLRSLLVAPAPPESR